ncbi:MAG TPA: hypothetical protein VGA67_05235, partial [Candidatus Dojkabacteria bacterium]
MEKKIWFSPENKFTSFEVVEVLTGLKQVCLVIKFHLDNKEILTLYRPENTLLVSIDPSIPKPQELYNDCAFSQQCNLLGWDQFLPVIPWSLDETDKGVIRPFLENVKQLEIFNFHQKALLSSDPVFWKTIAVADYVFGIGDRVCNDFLLSKEGTKVVDNGFSFLPGVD